MFDFDSLQYLQGHSVFSKNADLNLRRACFLSFGQQKAALKKLRNPSETSSRHVLAMVDWLVQKSAIHPRKSQWCHKLLKSAHERSRIFEMPPMAL
ncbi:hypothetical protein K7X08_037664 [Anisodus acutangulus]|uniref:Uncharacterized protein n=1 Tax=Anisodus acutangulus TaxID=402998 RepID=A0A9Q1N0S1_9SOLA|nr:hypothetical protein K7X08_037664 [Anisodus acutangulus]